MRSRKTPNADIEEGHRSILLGHLANISYRLGGKELKVDPKTEQIIANDRAAAFYRRKYRKPWIVEDQI